MSPCPRASRLERGGSRYAEDGLRVVDSRLKLEVVVQGQEQNEARSHGHGAHGDPDGRPHVPDGILERMKLVNIEEASRFTLRGTFERLVPYGDELSTAASA